MKYNVIYKVGSARVISVVDGKKAAEELAKKLGARLIGIEKTDES